MISVLACSLVAGAVDTTSERVDTAEWILLSGLFVLIIHVVVFFYRAKKKKQTSGLIFWSFFASSLIVIPIVFFMVMIAAGMSCGFGANNGPIFLLIFESIGLAAQVLSSRFSTQPAQSPIPLD